MSLITDAITYYRSTNYDLTASVTPPDGLSVVTGLFTVKTDEYDTDATDTDAIVPMSVIIDKIYQPGGSFM